MNPDLPGFLAFGAAAALAIARFVRPGPPPWCGHRALFILLLAAAFLAGRRDALRANFQIWNPDESQMLAGALVLAERPVFWRDVDGTTHGPLAQYPLLLPALLGGRPDYVSARLVGAGLTLLLLIVLHRALATGMKEGSARLLVLPAWSWLIFNQDPEMEQYVTELVPSLLIALAAWAVGRQLARGTLNPAACALAGLAAGAAPFAKLQAAPLAAWTVVFLLGATWRSPGRWRSAAAILGGATLPAAIFIGAAAAAGAAEDFWIRYVVVNLAGYVSEGATWFNSAPPTPDLIFGFGAFLWPMLAVLPVAGLGLAWQRLRPPGGLLAFTAGLFACAVAAIYLPQKPFGHYFLLGVGPLVLFAGALAGPLLDRVSSAGRPGPRALVASLAVLALAAPAAIHHLRHPGYFRSIVATRPPLARELIEAVQRHTTPGGRLAVWGWQPGLYVFTQTRSATPDLIVFWQIQPNPWQAFYRERYRRDFTARPPDVFVDTTGPADFFFFRDAAATRHENFPALAGFIADHYELVETAREARIYVRKPRAGTPTPRL